MKWFKHHSDAYTNLKIRDLLDEFGLEGYGLYWLCCELIAQQGGNDYQINNDRNWKRSLSITSKLSDEKLKNILQKLSELNLIDKEAFKKDILYIPKMKEYCDEYTKKIQKKSRNYPDTIQTESRECQDNIQTNSRDCQDNVRSESDFVRLEQNRIDKNKYMTNKNIRPITDYFYDLFKSKFGVKPMVDAGDAKRIKQLLERKTDPLSIEDIKKRLKWYIDTQKTHGRGVTIKGALSTYSLNFYNQSAQKRALKDEIYGYR